MSEVSAHQQHHFMLTVQGVVGRLNNPKAAAEAARPSCLQEVAEVGSCQPQVVEEVTVVDRQLPLAGNTDSRQHSFGIRHKQHRGHRLVGWHNIEPTGLHSLQANLMFRVPGSPGSLSRANRSYCCYASSCRHGLGLFHSHRMNGDLHRRRIRRYMIPSVGVVGLP